MKRPLDTVVEQDINSPLKKHSPSSTSFTQPSQDGDDLTTALWQAIDLDALDMKALYQYIKKKGDLTVLNPEGYGLLYLAARNNSMEALRLLLLQGDLDINQAHGPHQEQALHAAASAGNYDAIELLLEHGALTDGIDSLGHTALSNGLFAKSLPCLEMILDAGSPLDTVDRHGNSLLHLASSNQFVDAIPLLVTKGVPVDQCNLRRLPPLAIAISLGYQDIVDALIDNGADVNGSVRCATLVHYAVMWNRYGALESLVKKGAKVNVANAIEETPLLVAVQQRKIDMVSYLVQHGADPCYSPSTDDDSQPATNLPLLYAANHGYTEMCTLLISSKTSPYFIQMAADMSQRMGMTTTATYLRTKLNTPIKQDDAPAPSKQSVSSASTDPPAQSHQETSSPRMIDADFNSLINSFSDDEDLTATHTAAI